LQALGLSTKADRATYKFETIAGRTIERELVSVASRGIAILPVERSLFRDDPRFLDCAPSALRSE
jgi:hypothetical protein